MLDGFEPPTSGSGGLLIDSLGFIEEFKNFCEIDRALKPLTVEGHVRQVKRFLRTIEVPYITKNIIREYLRGFKENRPSTYNNVLKSLRVLLRDYSGRGDLVDSFKFRKSQMNFRIVPSKIELIRFYSALPTLEDRCLFLIYASSGLRKMEALILQRDQIDLKSGMIFPNRGSGTKRTWITLVNDECIDILRKYLTSRTDNDPRLILIGEKTLRRHWGKARKKINVRITPQVLREWFACEMGRLGVQDRYVDAFQGRIPKSVLARHYTDYSPERLKEIYYKAGLKVLS